MISKSDVARLRGLSRNRRDRRQAGRFVVEGEKLVAEVIASELVVRTIVANQDWDGLSRFGGGSHEVTPVASHVLERMASTASPQPVLAEVDIPVMDWDRIDVDQPVLVLADVNDPGNVGTLARSAEAAGFGAIVVLGATADPWGSKTVRAGAGALFRLAVVEERDVEAGLAQLGELGFRRIGTRMDGATACDELDLTGTVALVLGSEAHGLGADHDAEIDEWVSIPMAGDLESLNVAMAGTILTYELARQRRTTTG